MRDIKHVTEAYQTTDGRLHADAEAARRAQYDLDLNEFLVNAERTAVMEHGLLSREAFIPFPTRQHLIDMLAAANFDPQLA